MIQFAAILGLSGVAYGAFGAHALKGILTAQQLGWWATAVQYQLIHALVLLVMGVWQLVQPQKWLGRSAWFMVFGVLLFSGSLYSMALTDIRVLGAITPIGGSSWLIGWGLLIVAGQQVKQVKQTR
ncbi:MAG TPA: DUF423 domain-containing protein [Pseudomonadales bacterium]|nr:DUF423 domain-containing protein [Pseudomonadales bacterium]